MNSHLMLAAMDPWMHSLIQQALAFAILGAVLWKFVVPMLKKMLGERSKGIEDRFNTLERETKETNAKVAEIKEKLARIEDESKRRLQAATDEGIKTRGQVLAEANAQAAAELAKAKRDIGIERDIAVRELRDEVTRQTIEITEKIVELVVTESVHGQMVTKVVDNIEKVAAGK